MQNHDSDYVSAMTTLSRLCNVPLDDFMFEVYSEGLAELTFEQRARALKKIIMMRKPTDRFPGVPDILQAAGIDVDDGGANDKAKATEIAGRVWESIRKFGWNKPQEARDWLGDLPWQLVLMAGGWDAVTSIDDDNDRPTYIAQWRDMAISLLDKQRRGVPLAQIPGTQHKPNAALEAALNIARGLPPTGKDAK